MSGEGEWVAVCGIDRIDPEGGVAALVHGEAVAVIRTYDDVVYALSNYDPFSHASVLARGIVGTRTLDGDEVPFVASPMHKQAFDLRTGQCLDDEAVSVPTYEVRVSEGQVLIGGRREAT
ncbi:nitrite reductase (NAD(P)H) small subunit [Nocardioides mangrovicus]|uniref:Nitrite reductase (NAD(P)H) small subunit n=1 Tax=Nocardioides mangrovicus TaxID=2478913 RepID=A0A3L8P0Z5_9ACTN|nr:nitrite reductase small subunit NirD [Nocardioides mangrovicus]RLV48269.1 nitrite reductase (NAD(P)H) small subunit [Nocardioides mangrovicus]